MYKKKISIYVEGQTEQIFLNQLILNKWHYVGVNIKNIKLHSNQDKPSKVRNYLLDTNDESTILFLITDVDGVGSLTSAIANRANKQQENGFEIIGLRDLSAQDFDSLSENVDRIEMILQQFKQALQIKRCKKSENIDLFFAVMEIEAWMLAFTKAISKWAMISENEVLNRLSEFKLEEIKSPSSRLKKIGKLSEKNDLKSFDEVMSFASGITDSEINKVYESKRIPRFNKFWERLIF